MGKIIFLTSSLFHSVFVGFGSNSAAVEWGGASPQLFMTLFMGGGDWGVALEILCLLALHFSHLNVFFFFFTGLQL